MTTPPDGRPLDELFRLDGRTAVVTGAARGLGAAIAGRLHEAGASVVLADVDGEAAEAQARELQRAGAGEASAAVVDVRDEEQLQELAATAVARYGAVDVWVNNAGVFPHIHPLRATPAEIESVLAINVMGTQLGCRAAAEAMMAGGRGGVVVNISSVAGFRGRGIYSASKWAVRGITSGLAAQLGRHGIRVVGVAPSLVPTPGIERLRGARGSRLHESLTAQPDRPLGREATADDIALAVAFLASDAAAFITGITLPVDGGELQV